MKKKEILSDMRGTIEYLRQKKELLVAKKTVDPIYEEAGIQVALEEGPAILFEKLKGYPGMRAVGNIFARRDISRRFIHFSNFFGEIEVKIQKCSMRVSGILGQHYGI